MSDERVAAREQSTTQVAAVFACGRVREGRHARAAAVRRPLLVAVRRRRRRCRCSFDFTHRRRQRRQFVVLRSGARRRRVGVQIRTKQLRRSRRRTASHVTFALFPLLPLLLMIFGF